MSALAVWMYGKETGSLSRVRGRLSFSFTREALDLGVGRPLISVSMPTRGRAYTGDVPRAFFDGLLPEGEARRMLAYDFRVSDDDVLGLLSVLGRDCAGALVILPEGDIPEQNGRPEPITDVQVAERLRRLRVAPLGVDQRVRASLAGMQEKLLLSRLDDGWGLPVDGAPSTHILKPAHPLLVDSVLNEAFCMRVAHHLGVDVAETAVRTFDDVTVLAIGRYDRTRSDGRNPVTRIHQEDFCQAHATDSRRKYEEAGGPSLFDCARMLLRWSSSEQLDRLLDIAAVSALVGNADAHAKNVALLHDRDGKVQLAPAYDIMATTLYPGVSTTAGMFINGVRDITAVKREDLVREAEQWGLARNRAAERVDRLLAEAETAVGKAAADVQPPDSLVDAVLMRVASCAG